MSMTLERCNECKQIKKWGIWLDPDNYTEDELINMYNSSQIKTGLCPECVKNRLAIIVGLEED